MGKASKKAKYKNKNRQKKNKLSSEKNFLSKLLTSNHRKYLLLILIIGFVVFLPVLFNSFVWDDLVYVIDNPQVYQLNFPVLLGKNLFNSGLFYRPIPAVYFASLYTLFGQHAFFYHVIQLSLHFVSTYLLFIFFCLFFEEGISFILALIFLVHPINIESVAFIAGGTTSQLFFIPGMIAFLLAKGKNITNKKVVLISTLLLLSILAKETGFLFLIMILIYRYLWKLKRLKAFSLSGFGIVAVYAIIRIFVGGVTYSKLNNPIETLSLTQRLLNIPAIVIYYLRNCTFPSDLQIWQEWVVKSASFEKFFIPLILCIALTAISVFVGYLLYQSDKTQDETPLESINGKEKHTLLQKMNFPKYIFFLIWYVVGMGLIIQIVPLDMTVADRWFYFPIVGLLGIVGIGLSFLMPYYLQHKKIFLAGAFATLCLLSVVTFFRSFNWHDNVTLYTHDLQDQKYNYLLSDQLARELIIENKPDKALPYVKASIASHPTISNLSHLGLIYATEHKYDKAITAYQNVIERFPLKNSRANFQKESLATDPDPLLQETYDNLAETYLISNNPQDAVKLISTRVLNYFQPDEKLYIFLASGYSEEHKQDEALRTITKAYNLFPDKAVGYYYEQIINNKIVEFNQPS